MQLLVILGKKGTSEVRFDVLMAVTMKNIFFLDLKLCSPVEFEILTAVIVRSTLFWDVMPSIMVVHHCFKGTYCPYFQGQRIN